MARLVNNQGDFSIEIQKGAIHCELLLRMSEETEKSYFFQILDDDRDGVYSANGDEYVSILAKITDNPEPELVIPKDPPKLLTESEKRFNSIFHSQLANLYPNQHDLSFLKELGMSENTKDTTFRWSEENKLPNV